MPAVAKPVRRGKENAPPPSKTKTARAIAEDDDGDELAGDSFDDMDAEERVKPKTTIKSSRTLKAAKPRQIEEESDVMEEEEPRPSAPRGGKKMTADEGRTATDGDHAAKLAMMTAERDRMRRERDAFAKQFEELSKLRTTEAESVYERYKEKTSLKAKAQADLIQSLTALNDRQEAKVKELEKALAATQAAAEAAAQAALPPVLDAKLDGRDSKWLRDEVIKLRSTVKRKDEQMDTLQREYDAEVANSRKLQLSTRGSAAAPAAPVSAASGHSTEEAEKDALSLRLYEDLSGLGILSLRVRTTPAGKDVTYSCIQTVDERSFAFKLRAFNELDRSSKRWLKRLELTPEGLDKEHDKELLGRLGPFKQGFTVAREQLLGCWEQLRARLSRDGIYDEVPEVDE